jgi:Phytanoyl-CoA dioxygenase (PhyH)
MSRRYNIMQLSSNGRVLETTPAEFGELRDSNDLLGDFEALHSRITDDGYLLFRGLLDRGSVMTARREILLKFAAVGEIDSINYPVMEAIQSDHTFIDQVNLIAFTESVRSGLAYANVVHDPGLMSFFEGFLGGPVRTFDFRWLRFMRPGESTGIHCDGPYITRGTKNVWSAWIPLGDVPLEEGPLMILEGSHKNERLRQSYGTKDADEHGIGWLSTDPVGLRRRLGGRWLSTDFRAGDVMVFGPYLVHASLDNKSPKSRCRLTSDTRYLLVGDELDERWNGEIGNPHGGQQRVFLPGRGLGSNKDFQDEWKEVDEMGRLALTVQA